MSNPPSNSPSPAERVCALLLIAHGSRRREANVELEQLAAVVRSRSGFGIVRHSYLELASPDIPTGIASCIDAGATEVRMLPYFLSPGAHVVEDLNRYRIEAAGAFPSHRIVLCPPLGLHDRMVEIVLDRATQELAAAI